MNMTTPNTVGAVGHKYAAHIDEVSPIKIIAFFSAALTLVFLISVF